MNGIAGSKGNSVFNYLRNEQTIFQSSYIILHSHQPCMNMVNFSTFLPVFVIFDFLIMTILVGMEWYFIVVCFAFP